MHRSRRTHPLDLCVDHGGKKNIFNLALPGQYGNVCTTERENKENRKAKEDKAMTKKMKELAKEYRAPEKSTPENLECGGYKTLEFGRKTICIGYFWSGKRGEGHYAAVYEFTGGGHTCEDECRLIAISENAFEDEGSAAAWGLLQ